MKQPKPEYGLDSPVIIAGLLVVGTISLAAGLLRPHLFGPPMRRIGIIAGAYCLQGAVSLVYYSKVGKLGMRDRSSTPFRGVATRWCSTSAAGEDYCWSPPRIV